MPIVGGACMVRLAAQRFLRAPPEAAHAGQGPAEALIKDAHGAVLRLWRHFLSEPVLRPDGDALPGWYRTCRSTDWPRGMAYTFSKLLDVHAARAASKLLVNCPGRSVNSASSSAGTQITTPGLQGVMSHLALPPDGEEGGA